MEKKLTSTHSHSVLSTNFKVVGEKKPAKRVLWFFFPTTQWKSEKTVFGILTRLINSRVFIFPFLANLLRASNELTGNKANTEPFPIFPNALPPTSSLNVFLILCLFDLNAPTQMSKGLQEVLSDKPNKFLGFSYWTGKVLTATQ